ncbi:MAG: HAD-IIB family hydrolase [Defluviitaleaceae bacterium]|nr:HAD-IIB family hydrolase [Defluviitaleaceae bacterium]
MTEIIDTMDIKLIVTDLDRTLLRTDKSISDDTVDVLYRCHAAGIKLAFATARPLQGITKYIDILGAPPDAYILNNGARVYIAGEGYSHMGIAPDLRDATLRALAEAFPLATLSVEIGDELYGNDVLADITPKDYVVRSDFADLPDEDANVIIIGITTPEQAEQVAAYLPDDLYVHLSRGEEVCLGMIMHRNATKWAGVQAVAAHFGIPVGEVIAFGDDFNDVEMLANAGTGVAVANAFPEARAAAPFTCGANGDDGVAKWLDVYLDTQAENEYYKSLPCKFEGFIDLDTLPEGSLTDGVVTLVCVDKRFGDPVKKWKPSYGFHIHKNNTDATIGEKVGYIDLRIGYGGGPYNKNLYYGGQIGYGTDEVHRGNGYAVRACRLLIPVARAHDMHTLVITTSHDNIASQRVCEKLGAKLIRTAPLPHWQDMYADGQRYMYIYEWRINVTDDARAYLHAHGKDTTFTHSQATARVAVQIAKQYNLNATACEMAAYLHDISAVMPPVEMLRYAEENNWHIDETERNFPVLLHQRISRVIAKRDFRIADERILSAIEYHTTLRPNATPYDMVVFIADKLAWDQCEIHGDAPFFAEVSAALEISLEAACLAYMNYMEANQKLLGRHRLWDTAMIWLINSLK